MAFKSYWKSHWYEILRCSVPNGVLTLHPIFVTVGFFGKLNPFKKKQASIKPDKGILLHDILQSIIHLIAYASDSKADSVEVEATQRPFPSTDTGKFIINIRHASI